MPEGRSSSAWTRRMKLPERYCEVPTLSILPALLSASSQVVSTDGSSGQPAKTWSRGAPSASGPERSAWIAHPAGTEIPNRRVVRTTAVGLVFAGSAEAPGCGPGERSQSQPANRSAKARTRGDMAVRIVDPIPVRLVR